VSAAEHLIARVVIRRRVAEQSAFLVEIENESALKISRHTMAALHSQPSPMIRARASRWPCSPGRFQVRNALTALAAARMLANAARDR